MKKSECKKLLEMSDDCPRCKDGKMYVACQKWLDGENYYFLQCSNCDYSFEG